MKRLCLALFILGALMVPFSALAQVPFYIDLVPRILHVGSPAPEHELCIPEEQRVISLITRSGFEPNVEVEALWWDRIGNVYLMNVGKERWLVKFGECASKADTFHMWQPLLNGQVLMVPVFVYLILPEEEPLLGARFPVNRTR